jgi:pSer/pThr/pTyr-binding forkhead associated (FHA) protein
MMVPVPRETLKVVLPRLLPVSDEAELPPDFMPIRLVWIPCGMVFDLHRPHLTIGRHSQCDLRLPLPDVSRKHARLFYSGSEWVLEDCNSLNGTFVNAERVVRCSLHLGDKIRIGGFTLQVQPANYVADEEVLRQIAEAIPDQEQQMRRAS